MPATAVLTPTTRQALVTSAPPELPGFREASVWMTLSIVRTVSPARAGSERPSAETTPAVTEPAKPLRVADRDHELSHAQALGVAERRGREVVVLRAHDGEVGQRVGPDGRRSASRARR